MVVQLLKSKEILIYFSIILIFMGLFTLSACENKTLQIVTVADFKQFVEKTQYITDAEKFGWSIVQQDVYKYIMVDNSNWRCPDGLVEAKDSFPVTQVSYNDAKAYANWIGAELPTYKNYWKLVKWDKRKIHSNSSYIVKNNEVNLVGNVWEITTPDRFNRIRLAGGSYFCNERTCNGTHPDRELYVDPTTGNVNIGFAVIK